MPKLSKTHGILLLSLLVLVGTVYWPGLHGGFVFDDYPNVVNNPALHVKSLAWPDWVAAALSSPAASLPRPLAMLSFAVNHYLTGLDPVPMKATNIAIHMFNTLLVLVLARRLLGLAGTGLPQQRLDTAALLVAAAWALHPINLMAVLFVVQRMESFGHLFVFAGLWCYCLGRERLLRGANGWPWIVASLALFPILGILVKESAALLALYAFVVETCLLRFAAGKHGDSRKLKWTFVFLLAVPAVIGGSWLLVRSLGEGAYDSRDFTLAQRLMTEPRVLVDYLRWTVLPDVGSLSLYHDDYVISRGWLSPLSTLLSVAFLATLLAGAWALRSRYPLTSMGLLWFFAAHALTATFIPLELVFEHRNYFASLGICLVLVDRLVLAPTRAILYRIGVVVMLAFALVTAGMTALRSSEWRNPAIFAKSEAAKHPTSPRAMYYLGWMLATGSRYDPDSPLVEPAFQAFDAARRLPDSDILPDQGALVLAARTGTPLRDEWWLHMQQRLRDKPLGPQDRGALAGLVRCSVERKCAFRPEDMMATFGAAISRGPDAEILNMLGNYVLNVLQDPLLALGLWKEALSMNPAEPQYHSAIIKLLIREGQFAEARERIAELRAASRVGRHERLALELESRLQQAIRDRAATRYPPEGKP